MSPPFPVSPPTNIHNCTVNRRFATSHTLSLRNVVLVLLTRLHPIAYTVLHVSFLLLSNITNHAHLPAPSGGTNDELAAALAAVAEEEARIPLVSELEEPGGKWLSQVGRRRRGAGGRGVGWGGVGGLDRGTCPLGVCVLPSVCRCTVPAVWGWGGKSSARVYGSCGHTTSGHATTRTRTCHPWALTQLHGLDASRASMCVGMTAATCMHACTLPRTGRVAGPAVRLEHTDGERAGLQVGAGV